MSKKSVRVIAILIILPFVLLSPVMKNVIFIAGHVVFNIVEMFREDGKKPDDSLSHAVYDAVGKDLAYHGKEETSDEVTYRYELMKKDAETISKFVSTLNNSLDDKQKKISVYVSVEAKTPNLWTNVLGLFNYSESNLEKADYDGFRALDINSNDLDNWDSMFLEPSTYTGIEGIKKLEIDAQMQQRADEEGIDWYECWPELEEVIFEDDISHAVYDEVGSDYLYFLGNDRTEYSYQLKQTDADTISKFVKAVNSVLGDEQEEVWFRVFVYIPHERTDVYPDGRPEEVFSLSNCIGNKDCNGICDLTIKDPSPFLLADMDMAEAERFFPDPAVYIGIEGIKRLYIGERMQQRADEERIDWYECWPELEEITVKEPGSLVTQ